jgi:hypothetical protein
VVQCSGSCSSPPAPAAPRQSGQTPRGSLTPRQRRARRTSRPRLQSYLQHQPHRLPTAPATPGAAEPSPERALFDIIVRLVEEPTALAELAPKAKIEIYGVKDVDKHAIKDAKAELGFLFEKEHVQFAPPGTRLIDIRGSTVRCNAKELTCRASYGGGQTDFTFARQNEKVVLKSVISQLN